MKSSKKAISYAREVPIPDFDGHDIIYEIDNWDQLSKALEADADILVIAFPEVLGDRYTELIINLGKIADSGKTLSILNPSPWVKQKGALTWSDRQAKFENKQGLSSSPKP